MDNFFLKSFFSKVWEAVCKVAEFIGKLFGFKAENLYARVIWKVIVGSVAVTFAIYTIFLGYFFVSDVVLGEWFDIDKYKEQPSNEVVISNDVVFQKFKNGATRLYNKRTGKSSLEGLDWVVVSDDMDTLAVFSKDYRRGYVNRCTGEVEIPAIYTRAWVFSEGLAAVEKNNELVFIDHNGDVVIDKDFEVYIHGHNYNFKNGYCLMRSNKNKKFGYIDKSGNWVLEPEFSYIHPKDNFIIVRNNAIYGLYSADMKEIFPMEYECIIVKDGLITVFNKDFTAKMYDYELNLKNDFVIKGVEDLYYDINETVIITNDIDDGETLHGVVHKIAKCKRYSVGPWGTDRYGLMSQSGKRITPPIYDDITAIGPGRYLCTPQGVVLNDMGKIVK